MCWSNSSEFWCNPQYRTVRVSALNLLRCGIFHSTNRFTVWDRPSEPLMTDDSISPSNDTKQYYLLSSCLWIVSYFDTFRYVVFIDDLFPLFDEILHSMVVSYQFGYAVLFWWGKSSLCSWHARLSWKLDARYVRKRTHTQINSFGAIRYFREQLPAIFLRPQNIQKHALYRILALYSLNPDLNPNQNWTPVPRYYRDEKLAVVWPFYLIFFFKY